MSEASRRQSRHGHRTPQNLHTAHRACLPYLDFIGFRYICIYRNNDLTNDEEQAAFEHSQRAYTGTKLTSSSKPELKVAENIGNPDQFHDQPTYIAKMETPTPQDKDGSRSVSEKSSSDKEHTQQTPSRSTTLENRQMHDATPTAARSKQSIGTPAMPPPPKPNFKATPTSAQPSSHSTQDSSQEPSAAMTEKKRVSGSQCTTSSKDSSQEATKPVTRKRSHEEIDRRKAAEDVDNEDDDDDDVDATDEFNEPANAISPFDWTDLRRRYHQQVQYCSEQEQDLYRQFGELCQVRFSHHINRLPTDNRSTSTSGPSPEPTTRRNAATNGSHIHSTSAATKC